MSEDQAQEDYDTRTALLRGLYGNDLLGFESAANDILGDNALKKISGEFWPYDGGWIDDLQFDAAFRDRLSAHTYQEVVAAYAMAKSAFREAQAARRGTSRAVPLLLLSLTLNVAVLATLWIGQ